MASSAEYVLADDRVKRLSQDQRAEYALGALSSFTLVIVYAMLLFIFLKAWPSFQANGIHWLVGGGNVDDQLHTMFESGNLATGNYTYEFHAWPLIYGTLLIVGITVFLSFWASLFAAVFIVEFAPHSVKRVLIPVVRLLASVPSVVYGLLGVLVLVPIIRDHVITSSDQESVAYIISLNGYSLIAGVIVLSLMVAPIMVTMFSDGLAAIPRLWIEGSLALGVNRWRTFWKIAVRGARPSLVAGTVLATARGVGETVAIAMVAGGTTFLPNIADGKIFLLEPVRPVTVAMLFNVENIEAPPLGATLFALSFLLLIVTMILSITGYVIKQPMKKYGIRA